MVKHKYIVKEDKLITEFIGSLLKAIVKKRSISLVKVLEKDLTENSKRKFLSDNAKKFYSL